MESQKGLNGRIVATTLKIHAEFPELSKYLEELPEHFRANPNDQLTNKELKDYLNSLHELRDNYATTH